MPCESIHVVDHETFTEVPSFWVVNLQDHTHNAQLNEDWDWIEMALLRCDRGRVNVQLVDGTWTGAPSFNHTFEPGAMVMMHLGIPLTANATLILSNMDNLPTGDYSSEGDPLTSGSSSADSAWFQLSLSGCKLP